MTWIPSDPFRRGSQLVLLALGLAWAFSQTGLHQRLQGWTEDAQHRMLGPVLDMGDVVIVDIDEESIDRLKSVHGPWPYSRDLYAHLVRYLSGLGARAFAFDILLAESRAGDAVLAEVLKENAVVAAAAFPRAPLRTQEYQRHLTETSIGRLEPFAEMAVAVNRAARPSALAWPDITLPIGAFVEPGRARVGVISVRPDEDGTLRRIPLFHRAHGYLFPSFPLAAWASRDDMARMESAPGLVRIRDRTFHLDADGEILLRFPSELRRFRIVPFNTIWQAASATALPVSPSGEWEGKTVFIGSSSILFGDYAHTPMGRVSGLVLSAIVRQSLQAGYVFRPVHFIWSLALMILATVPALVWLLRKDGSLPGGFAWAALVTIAAILPLGMLLFHTGWLVPWPLALITGVFALCIAASQGVLRLRSERERLAYERVAAQEANRMKGEFLAHMAHELRTPLIAIMGFNKINQVNDHIGPAQRQRNSSIIADNCEHLLKLVNDNLDLATIESGQVTLTPGAHAVPDLVDDVISTFGSIVAEKGIALEVRYERPIPDRLWFDAVRVRQVLINILGNAVKFTDRGRVDVLIRWRDDVLDLSVTDTGPGIEPSVAQRLFMPFQQGEAGIRRRHSGTGLGLHIARSLLHLMGGDITLESWPGQGSRFRFWLPARISAPTEATALPALPGRVTKLEGRVLLAEDDEDIRALMERELGELGLKCLAVADGLEAVRACESGRFDVILLDLEMPALTGVEAVQVLRAQGVVAPIIALTAHGIGAQTQSALAHGFDSVLVKPVSTDVLLLRLAQHLRPASEHAPLDHEA